MNGNMRGQGVEASWDLGIMGSRDQETLGLSLMPIRESKLRLVSLKILMK